MKFTYCYHAEGYVLRLRAFQICLNIQRKMHGNTKASGRYDQRK